MPNPKRDYREPGNSEGSANLAALDSKTVLLGITGGISAYKSIEVLRSLMHSGAHVIPIMTESAKRFVGETTVSALASVPVRTNLFQNRSSAIEHTGLGQKADLIVICPATAKTIGKYANGICDDLLINALIATEAPVLIAPAMHTEMWQHPAVRDNVNTLIARGVNFVGPESGLLAGGDYGLGRLSEPEMVVEAAARILQGSPQLLPAEHRLSESANHTGVHIEALEAKKVLISAGGTREPIDPVRYLSNRSTGRQGHAIAKIAAQSRAEVTVVTTNPAHLENMIVAESLTNIAVIAVETAAEMAEAIKRHSDNADIAIMTAAVADFTPRDVAEKKIKKADGLDEIVLVPTEDILATLGENKPDGQILVGFAAETDNLVENAEKKLRSKKLDMIVANDISQPGVGFASETNAVTIIRTDGSSTEIAKSAKSDIAIGVLNVVAELVKTQTV